MTRSFWFACLWVAATPAFTHAEPTCAVSIVRAPDDVRAAIESWVAKETCTTPLTVRIIETEGGEVTDSAHAELWWRRLHMGEPTPAPNPALQIMGTPTTLPPVYKAVMAEATLLGIAASAHISRFDPDGGLVFVTLEADPTAQALIEKAAEVAGGWLLGARATKLDGYLRALRAELDPRGIMNPGTLA